MPEDSAEPSTSDLYWRSQPDADLVRACIEGNHFAWREVVYRYQRLIYSIPRRYGLDESTSEDVMQDVLAAFINQAGSIQNRQGLAKWFITTAQRITQQHARRRKREQSRLPDDDIEDSSDTADWESQHLIRQALRQLNGRCEELLTALYLNPGRPDYDRIADQLSMPRGSIGPTRARCLEKLLALLPPGLP